MPAILPNFEYDIFISYRHNDNRSGWVTDFVNALQEELATTIKEPLSIYFDKNPHDGLLETHNVDKSLEEKLKCLIFIPIVSQTYCDEKSFAWRHEFCAFNKLAKEDSFGRDIKLSNGNVASRILPIKIHDLDAEDKVVIENEIGGVLRAIEFIYKEAGVNRPLRSNEENPTKNQNQTIYRNQVNKTANATKEIINALKHPATAGLNKHESGQIKAASGTLRKKLVFVSFALIAAFVAAFFLFSKWNVKDEPVIDKSIAVLPFVDMSPDHDQEYFGDGVAEEIITALSRIKGLKVIGRTSSFQFKGEKVDLRDVGEKLSVSNVLEGSIMKSGNKIRVTAQLINVKDGAHIWSERFDRETEDIFAINDQISKAIADKMKISLLGNPHRSDRKPTSSSEAFENYLRGTQVLRPGRGKEARPFFEKAIQLDSTYADAYAGLAWSYLFGWQAPPLQMFDRTQPLAMKVLELDPESEKSHAILYTIYSEDKWDWKRANDEYQKYLSINSIPLIFHAVNKVRVMGDVQGGIKELEQILEVDPINRNVLIQLGFLFALEKQYAKGKELINKAIEMDPADNGAYRGLALINILAGEYEVALRNLDKSDRFDGNMKFRNNAFRIWALVKAGRLGEAKQVYATMDLSKEDDGSGFYLPLATKAKIEFWMGHVDEGFRWLEKALDQREYDVLSIRSNPQYDVIRDHPRFKEFVKKVPFPPND